MNRQRKKQANHWCPAPARDHGNSLLHDSPGAMLVIRAGAFIEERQNGRASERDGKLVMNIGDAGG